MSKYEPLWQWISQNVRDEQVLSFEEIGAVLGFPPNHSFLNCKKELAEYGFVVGKISMKERTVCIERRKE